MNQGRVYNRSFFGSLNKTLREKMGEDYERVVLLLINGEKINQFADKGYVKFYTDIAIKGDSESVSCLSKDELLGNLNDCIGDEDHLKAELDVFDDGKECILVPEDIEAIIVDNEKILEEVKRELSNLIGAQKIEDINFFISPLPRD